MQRYLDIINHFGLRSQMKKLHEEIYEFLEAVDNFEDAKIDTDTDDNKYFTEEELQIFRSHVIEELGDVLILLTQFIARYNITQSEVDTWMDYKLERTENRIKNKFYDKGE